MDTREFRDRVDYELSRIKLDGELPDWYVVFDIEYDYRQAVNDVTGKIGKLIIGRAQGNPDVVIRTLGEVQSHLVGEHILNEAPLNPYLEIATRIRGVIPNGLKPLGYEVVDFNDIVRLGCVLYLLEPDERQTTEWWRTFDREHRKFTAARELKREFGQIGVEKGEVSIPDTVASTITEEIEQGIKSFGGKEFLGCLMGHIEKEVGYSEDLERFLFRREMDLLGRARTQTPWGFLFNLGVKHAKSKRALASGASAVFERIMKLASDLFACYDVQASSIWGYIFAGPIQIRELFQEASYYDSSFTIPQYRWSDVRRIILGIFDWLGEDLEREIFGFTLAELVAYHERLIEHFWAAPVKPLITDHNEVGEGLLNVGNSPVTEVGFERIKTVYSYPEGEPNALFESPADFDKVDIFQMPVIPLGGESVMMIHPSVYPIGVYERLFKMVKDCPDVDDNVRTNSMGTAFENLIISYFEEQGINCARGRYRNREGQADLIVEDEKYIHLIEAKMKSLTRLARNGMDVKLFLDVCESFLDSQVQLMRHEVVLRERGVLELISDSGDFFNIELKGRNINRISLTLHDFGAFQYRIWAVNYIKCFLGPHYVLSDRYMTESNGEYAEFPRRFEGLNRSIDRLRAQYLRLTELGVSTPEFETWFLCFGHLAMLLDGVKTPGEFTDNLKAIQFVSAQTFNTYFDYYYSKKHLG